MMRAGPPVEHQAPGRIPALSRSRIRPPLSHSRGNGRRHCQLVVESETNSCGSGAGRRVVASLSCGFVTVNWSRKIGQIRTSLKFSRITLN
jgi:hypothetical protein